MINILESTEDMVICIKNLFDEGLMLEKSVGKLIDIKHDLSRKTNRAYSRS